MILDVHVVHAFLPRTYYECGSFSVPAIMTLRCFERFITSYIFTPQLSWNIATSCVVSVCDVLVTRANQKRSMLETKKNVDTRFAIDKKKIKNNRGGQRTRITKSSRSIFSRSVTELRSNRFGIDFYRRTL